MARKKPLKFIDDGFTAVPNELIDNTRDAEELAHAIRAIRRHHNPALHRAARQWWKQ